MGREVKETTKLDESFLEAIIEDLDDEEEREMVRLMKENHRLKS